ncbi:cell division protein PerM [Nakamurella leprariae]|uniref:Uncharacterized protein n=1 Tax=Nakamurella leprariae TaxID=2803911 RepID=A0A938Y884_9ACTN|nr:DUF6350 family protein [Nakamurella leprariae]MBM9467640.1 hypothetical protein [Nakamurella leprariae]
MRQSTLERLVPSASALPRGWTAALAAVARSVAVGAGSLLLVCGVTLLLWALTPESTGQPADALGAGVAVFAAANLVTVTVAGLSVTLVPLLLTLLIALTLGVSARRAAARPLGRAQELGAIAAGAGSSGLFVAVTTRSFTPDGMIGPEAFLPAAALALVAVGIGVLGPDSAWRAWLRGRTPGWLQAGFRAGLAGALALVAAGGLAVAAAVAASFTTAAGFLSAATPDGGSALGLTVLQVVLTPNAAVAALGYLTGVGLELGQASFSPFGSVPGPVPGLPLLAGVPHPTAPTAVGLAVLLLPLAVAGLVGHWVTRRVGHRRGRLGAVVAAAIVAGLVVAVLALVAGGGIAGSGVTGSATALSVGADPLRLGAVVAAGIAVVGGAVAALVPPVAGARTPSASDPGARRAAVGSSPAARRGRRRGGPTAAAPAGATASTDEDDAGPDPVDGADDGAGGIAGGIADGVAARGADGDADGAVRSADPTDGPAASGPVPDDVPGGDRGSADAADTAEASAAADAGTAGDAEIVPEPDEDPAAVSRSGGPGRGEDTAGRPTS